MAQLVEDDKSYPQVQWDTPVNQLIRDDFVLADEYATQHTTIEDLLCHRTSLPRHDHSYGNGLSRDVAVREIVRSLRHLPLTAEPRTKFQYGNIMFIAASHVIQTVTGEWLGDLLSRRIWQPLDMKATFFSLEDAQAAKDDLATGYSYPWATDDDDDGNNKGSHKNEYVKVPWMNLNELSGAGSVITNVLDYAKWTRSLMYGTGPMSSEARKATWEPRNIMFSSPQGPFTGPTLYALGWWTGIYHGQQYYGHSGDVNAFGAELILFPDLKYSVILLGNTAGTSNCAAKKLAFHLIDEKLGIPAEKRFDWDKYHRAMIDHIKGLTQDPIKHFYPSLSLPHLPTTLPLSAYPGTYTHPGYQTLIIYLDQAENILRADRKNTTWPEDLSFEHVSRDYFVVRSVREGDIGAFVPSVYPAEFVIGVDGLPKMVGVGFEEAMGKEGRIWFKRV